MGVIRLGGSGVSIKGVRILRGGGCFFCFFCTMDKSASNYHLGEDGFYLMVNGWFGLVVWIPIPLWKGLLLRGISRIPNHRFTISWKHLNQNPAFLYPPWLNRLWKLVVGKLRSLSRRPFLKGDLLFSRPFRYSFRHPNKYLYQVIHCDLVIP